MERSLFAADGIYARVMNRLWNYIIISLLWLLCCIPVVTVGASCTAAYFTAAKVIRGKEGKPISEFFHAFRLNIKQGICFTVIYGAVLAVLLLECYYLYQQSSVPLPVLYLFYGMVLVLIASGQYLFTCLSRFTLGNFALFRMAALATFRHLISTILLLLLLAVTAVAVYLMPWGIFIFPGLMFWLKSYITEPVLRKYMPPREEADSDEQKWYYNI